MENKPECEIDHEGTKRWYLEDIPHREDGPAFEYPNGDKVWWFHGKIHRLDGPAIVRGDNGPSGWFVNDCDVTDLIIKWSKENDIDLNNLTEMDKALIKLVWVDYGN